MKVFVITKNTLIYIGIALLVLIVALIVAALPSGAKGGEKARDKKASARTDNTQSSQSVAAGAHIVEEYELEVFAGLMKELPVYSVHRDDKKIALTIDAAWQDDKTQFILDTLDKYNIKATFFLCGFWVNDHADMVKKIALAGHEIGNHSMTHPHMNKLSSTQINKELDEFEAAIESVAGVKPTLFRVPYGEYNDNVVKTLRQRGYEVVQWNIDTIDWREERTSQAIIDTVFSKLKDGSIILSHNNGYKIEQYLPAVIEKAISEGYEFVKVSELLLDGKTLIDVNGVQKAAED